MDFIHGELNERQVRYRRAMMSAAERYPVRFLGGPVFYPGRNPSLTHTSDGPFGVAGDLMGQTELFTAVHENPAFVSELLRIVTDKLITYLDFCWTEESLTARDLSWTDDLAAGLSAESYRQLVLPQEKRLRFHFDGRASLHMCGRTDHLLEIFRDDLAIDEYQGFGYQVELDRVAAVMGGKVVLLGNVNPFLVLQGPPRADPGGNPAVHREARTTQGVHRPGRREHPPGNPYRTYQRDDGGSRALRPVLIVKDFLANPSKLCHCQLIHDCNGRNGEIRASILRFSHPLGSRMVHDP